MFYWSCPPESEMWAGPHSHNFEALFTRWYLLSRLREREKKLKTHHMFDHYFVNIIILFIFYFIFTWTFKNNNDQTKETKKNNIKKTKTKTKKQTNKQNKSLHLQLWQTMASIYHLETKRIVSKLEVYLENIQKIHSETHINHAF